MECFCTFLGIFQSERSINQGFQFCYLCSQSSVSSGQFFNQCFFRSSISGSHKGFLCCCVFGNLSGIGADSRQKIFGDHLCKSTSLDTDGFYIVFQFDLITGSQFFFCKYMMFGEQFHVFICEQLWQAVRSRRQII